MYRYTQGEIEQLYALNEVRGQHELIGMHCEPNNTWTSSSRNTKHRNKQLHQRKSKPEVNKPDLTRRGRPHKDKWRLQIQGCSQAVFTCSPLDLSHKPRVSHHLNPVQQMRAPYRLSGAPSGPDFTSEASYYYYTINTVVKFDSTTEVGPCVLSWLHGFPAPE